MKGLFISATVGLLIGGTGAIAKQPALTSVGIGIGTLGFVIAKQEEHLQRFQTQSIAKQEEHLQQFQTQSTDLKAFLAHQKQEIETLQRQLEKVQQNSDQKLAQIQKQNQQQQNQLNLQNTRQRLILSGFDKIRHQQKENQKASRLIQGQIEKMIKQTEDYYKTAPKAPAKVITFENPKSSSVVAHSYIDGNNLGLAAQKMNIEIDYKSLKIFLSELAQEANQLAFNYYLGVGNQLSQRKHNQIRELKTLHYKLTTFPQVQREDGGWKTIGDDIGIAVDMMKDVKKGDILLLVSGDGDYIPVLKEIKNRGAFVILLSQANILNPGLRRLADRVILLDEYQEKLAKYRKLNIA